MNFEKVATSGAKKEKTNFYPERAFLRIDDEIDKIKRIESGEIKTIELSDIERENVLSFENELGKKLEGIEDIKANSNTFYLDYFIFPEGKSELSTITGLAIPGNTAEEIKNFLLKNRQLLSSLDKKQLSGLAGKSKIFSEEILFKRLNKTMDDNGQIDIREINNHERLQLLLNPQEALEKIKKLRQLKKELKEQEKISGSDNEILAVKKIKDLYRKKVNVMIAEQAGLGLWATELEKYLGKDILTDDEKELAKVVPSLGEPEEIFSRYDRFIHGVDEEYNETGMRQQVGEKLFAYAQEVDNKFLDGELKKESLIREKGLDPEKIEKKNISVEEFSKWAKELLEFYNNKNGKSSDTKKWKFVTKEEYGSMSVSSKQKIIKSGTKDKSISGALSTLLGHEFTHLLQAENREKIPLRLFSDKIGGFRSEVFSEGGAMFMENNICKELFGYENNPKPHYIRAMAKKLEGGNYLDCIKTYYESGLEGILIKRNNGQISEEKFKEDLAEVLKTAINRTKRLFKNGDDLNNTNNYLTHSKDTVYAEQILIMEKLRKNRLENCAFVKGVNLDTLATLAEIGFIDLDKIERPNIEIIRKIWQQEKSKYKL